MAALHTCNLVLALDLGGFDLLHLNTCWRCSLCSACVCVNALTHSASFTLNSHPAYSGGLQQHV